MKENLVLLAKLLATDDAFNLAFSSAKTDEEKFELSKTKINDLTRDDFSEFLEKLREAEKSSLSDLSMDELQMVSGGAGGLATKLAAAAMFVTALGATGVVSQQAHANCKDIFRTLNQQTADASNCSNGTPLENLCSTIRANNGLFQQLKQRYDWWKVRVSQEKKNLLDTLIAFGSDKDKSSTIDDKERAMAVKTAYDAYLASTGAGATSETPLCQCFTDELNRLNIWNDADVRKQLDSDFKAYVNQPRTLADVGNELLEVHAAGERARSADIDALAQACLPDGFTMTVVPADSTARRTAKHVFIGDGYSKEQLAFLYDGRCGHHTMASLDALDAVSIERAKKLLGEDWCKGNEHLRGSVLRAIGTHRRAEINGFKMAYSSITVDGTSRRVPLDRTETGVYGFDTNGKEYRVCYVYDAAGNHHKKTIFPENTTGTELAGRLRTARSRNAAMRNGTLTKEKLGTEDIPFMRGDRRSGTTNFYAFSTPGRALTRDTVGLFWVENPQGTVTSFYPMTVSDWLKQCGESHDRSQHERRSDGGVYEPRGSGYGQSERTKKRAHSYGLSGAPVEHDGPATKKPRMGAPASTTSEWSGASVNRGWPATDRPSTGWPANTTDERSGAPVNRGWPATDRPSMGWPANTTSEWSGASVNRGWPATDRPSTGWPANTTSEWSGASVKRGWPATDRPSTGWPANTTDERFGKSDTTRTDREWR